MQALGHQPYWLGLHLIPDFGIATLNRFLRYLDSAEALWLEPTASLMRLDLPPSLLRKFCDARSKIDLTLEMERVSRAGAHLVTMEDDNYPTLLRHLPDRPLLLYVRGSLTDGDEQCLAIVGTRKASKYGRDAAKSLSRQLAQQGVTIVSGLAHGIDAAAHRGALDGGGRTIAVVATGIDKTYPRAHEELADKIAETGAVISEMPLGTAPLGKNFPQRNRIISGISQGVLVAEAPAKSGAMNTVKHAIDQGRDVFAIPHNIFSAPGRGCNILLQEGASLVMGAEDVLDELNIARLNTQTRIQTEEVRPADATEDAVFQHLSADPVHVDVIVRLTNLPTAMVTSTLTLLELKGLVESAGPMQYCRAR